MNQPLAMLSYLPEPNMINEIWSSAMAWSDVNCSVAYYMCVRWGERTRSRQCWCWVYVRYIHDRTLFERMLDEKGRHSMLNHTKFHYWIKCVVCVVQESSLNCFSHAAHTIQCVCVVWHACGMGQNEWVSDCTKSEREPVKWEIVKRKFQDIQSKTHVNVYV